jgi:hypothetical protein
MDKSHRIQFTLLPEDFEAIGSLAAHYSLIEMHVAVGIWHLLKLPAYEGTLVTGNMSLNQRFGLLIELTKIREIESNDIAELKSIETEFSKKDGITARRNRYILAVWAADAPGRGPAFPINFNRRGKLRTGAHTSAEVIEAVTKDICTQAKRFADLLSRLGFSLDAGISFGPPNLGIKRNPD